MAGVEATVARPALSGRDLCHCGEDGRRPGPVPDPVRESQRERGRPTSGRAGGCRALACAPVWRGPVTAPAGRRDREAPRERAESRRPPPAGSGDDRRSFRLDPRAPPEATPRRSAESPRRRPPAGARGSLGCDSRRQGTGGRAPTEQGGRGRPRTGKGRGVSIRRVGGRGRSARRRRVDGRCRFARANNFSPARTRRPATARGAVCGRKVRRRHRPAALAPCHRRGPNRAPGRGGGGERAAEGWPESPDGERPASLRRPCGGPQS